MKKFNTKRGYISMNKAFSFIAITILLITSFIPFGNSIATKENEIKTVEVPVEIYTLHGVKRIEKELPMNEAMQLMHRGHLKFMRAPGFEPG